MRAGTKMQLVAGIVAGLGLVAVGSGSAHAATTQAAAPAITVSPNVEVVGGSDVEFAVTGFAAEDSVVAAVCVVGDEAPCDWGYGAEIVVDSTGAGNGSLTARAAFEKDGVLVDCRVADEGCYVLAINVSATDWAVWPLTFAADQ